METGTIVCYSQCHCCIYGAGGNPIVLSSPTMCPAVDIALSLWHLWFVAPSVLGVHELLLAVMRRRELKINAPRRLTA